MGRCFLAALLCLLVSVPGAGKVPSWFGRAVIYEVYPSAFADHDGDGMGDINGITDRLDYIRDLGCNTIWINACFCSEFRDGGYDVTDYYHIAPRYGSNDDMRRLIAGAHRRGMRVLLDLVAGHTSLGHPWFRKSMLRDSNEYTDRYIWTRDTLECPPKFCRLPPADSIRNGCYLKNYFPFQPALNYGYGHPDPARPWEEPVTAAGPTATRQELVRVMNYWMDMGCDGFRVDMAGSLVKNDPGLSATAFLWHEVRRQVFSRHPDGVLLAEWGHPERARRIGFTADFLFQFGLDGWRDLFCQETGVYRRDTCFFDARGVGSPRRFIRSLYACLDSLDGQGYVCLPTGNHDVQRLNCGRRSSPGELKTALAFILTMPCVPCIYYGDEVGMRYREGLPDIEGSLIRAGNRAGSRTPMEWDRVRAQRADSRSVWQFVRQLLRLRSRHPALGTDSEVRFLKSDSCDYPLTYVRQGGGERLLLSVNPSARSMRAVYHTRPGYSARVLLKSGQGGTVVMGRETTEVTVSPFSFILCKIK